jgi:hypothetical protein
MKAQTPLDADAAWQAFLSAIAAKAGLKLVRVLCCSPS